MCMIIRYASIADGDSDDDDDGGIDGGVCNVFTSNTLICIFI